MQVTILDNGNLEIITEEHDTERLDGDYQERTDYMVDELRDDYMFVEPEWVSALTDAPILAKWGDVYIPPSNEQPRLSIHAEGLWWFPNYQIECPWETLRDTGRVVFQAEQV